MTTSEIKLAIAAPRVRISPTASASHLMALPEEPSIVARMWVHECKRVFEDRLLFEDIPKFRTELQKVYDSCGLNEFEKNSRINEDFDIYTTFMAVYEGNDKIYNPTPMEELKKVLEEKLLGYLLGPKFKIISY